MRNGSHPGVWGPPELGGSWKPWVWSWGGTWDPPSSSSPRGFWGAHGAGCGHGELYPEQLWESSWPELGKLVPAGHGGWGEGGSKAICPTAPCSPLPPPPPPLTSEASWGPWGSARPHRVSPAPQPLSHGCPQPHSSHPACHNPVLLRRDTLGCSAPGRIKLAAANPSTQGGSSLSRHSWGLCLSFPQSQGEVS